MVSILGIETSCDETAAAVVINGRRIASSIVASQIDLHAQYGGVFPEVASRAHVEAIGAVVDQALTEAGTTINALDAIAVTRGPGLVGSLLVGIAYAKGLTLMTGKPLLGINHLEGHVYSLWLTQPFKDVEFPVVVLIVSGGHTELLLMTGHGQYQRLGGTLDDAAGEAFDKVARVLGLPYPGGPALEALAKEGDPYAILFPAGYNSGDGLDFSFSGLKTAVINYLHTAEQRGETISRADVAASFQRSVIEVLTSKAVRAAQQQHSRALALAGGVSANRALADSLKTAAEAAGVLFFSPELKYCTDNAAMIGCAGYYALRLGLRDSLPLNACARR